MTETVRVALANIEIPKSPDDAVARAVAAIAAASDVQADIVCFPEAYVPGYRCFSWSVPPPDPVFLQDAWDKVAAAAGAGDVAVILGTERVIDGRPRISALVVDRDGTVAGFQDKVQLDPSEDATYVPGDARRIFRSGPLTFGVVICHEGWRYPETVRWAARRGAQVVFHPHLHIQEPGSYVPSSFGEPGNSFHEKAALCRAAENTCFFATVNCASKGSGTTSAIAAPDGTLRYVQPYNQTGLLVGDLDLREATGLLASRFRPASVADAQYL